MKGSLPLICNGSGLSGHDNIADIVGAAPIESMVAPSRNVGYRQRMKAPPSPSNEAVRDQGDFYVESDCCLLCGVPENIAPELFQTDESHCFVKRQPCSRDEVDRTIRAMWSSEVDCIRYRGHDATMLERLARAGMASQADHGGTSVSPICLRDQVSFEMSQGAPLMDASQVARAFREGMRTKGNKVLPALFGRRSVWVSWYQNRFHLVCFADAGHGRFVARLRWTIAPQGLAWLVDDWLRAQSVENIQWEATGDPSSASPTPM